MTQIQKWNKCLFFKYLRSKLMNTKYHLNYSLVGEHSDIFVVSANVIEKFARYYGLFVAVKLFVKLTIPTSLVLTEGAIKTESLLKIRGEALWYHEYYILKPYQRKLRNILNDFPSQYLYLHPVKLSK